MSNSSNELHGALRAGFRGRGYLSSPTLFGDSPKPTGGGRGAIEPNQPARTPANQPVR